MKEIRTRKGLEELLRRYQENGVDDTTPAKGNYQGYWISTIKGCISSLDTAEPIAMDETDYENTPNELRKLWKGLR